MIRATRPRRLPSVFTAFLFLAAAAIAAGQTSASPGPADVSSPAGRWRTIDDATGKPKSVVKLWIENGQLLGSVEKVLDPPPGEPNPVCKSCEGELKDRPVVGMRILWGMKKDGGQWSGGTILDPHNGKSYKCSVSLEDGGRRLKVRGYIGISLLGRTQRWYREP